MSSWLYCVQSDLPLRQSEDNISVYLVASCGVTYGVGERDTATNTRPCPRRRTVGRHAYIICHCDNASVSIHVSTDVTCWGSRSTISSLKIRSITLSFKSRDSILNQHVKWNRHVDMVMGKLYILLIYLWYYWLLKKCNFLKIYDVKYVYLAQAPSMMESASIHGAVPGEHII